MLKVVLKCFILIAIFDVLCALVQGYNYDNTTNKYLATIQNFDYFNSDHFYLRHSRNRDTRSSREPRFISFETKDNNIEVEIDFAIPFLTIPVKRSMQGAMSTAQTIMSGLPMANLNIGAIVLAGFVAIGGSLIGILTNVFQESGTPNSSTGSWFSNPRKKYRDENTIIWNTINQINHELLKNNIDTMACTQKTICWYVKDAMANIADRKGTKLDKIISGLANSDWAIEIASEMSINSALEAAKTGKNCEKLYKKCNFNISGNSNFNKMNH